jgi:putative inorganic carbon (hco3(-)) transporter
LAWCFITVLWAPNLVSARQQTVSYLLGLILLFLFHNVVDSKRELRFLLQALLVGGWVLVIAGVVTLLSTGFQPGTRLKIFDVNQNLVPTLLVLALPGVLCATASPRHVPRIWIALAAALYLFATLLLVALSGSRGGLLSFVTALVLLMISPQTRMWGLLGLGLGVMALVVAPLLFLSVEDRLLNDASGFLGGRTILWETGWALLSDYPFGGGVGNGKAIVPGYLNLVASFKAFGVRTGFSTHNPLLDVGIDTGFPGMFLYGGAILVALASFLRACLRAGTSHDCLPPAYLIVVFAATAGYAVSWVRDGAMNHHPSIFIVLALLLVPSRIRERAEIEASDHPPNGGPS